MTANSGQTLTLDASDPILSTRCPGGGIKIANKGSNAPNQSFTIDCQTNQAAPIMGSGIGIRLAGPNLSAINCYVDGFTTGMEADGDGADIEDSQVQNATGDGFVVKSKVKITNADLVGVTFTGNLAFSNGGRHAGARLLVRPDRSRDRRRAPRRASHPARGALVRYRELMKPVEGSPDAAFRTGYQLVLQCGILHQETYLRWCDWATKFLRRSRRPRGRRKTAASPHATRSQRPRRATRRPLR